MEKDQPISRIGVTSMQEKVRPVAICVCRDGDRILVAEYYDRKKKQVFHRPLGGTIEFGERGEEAVRRELKEELGAELEAVRFLGALENIFLYEGRRGHELVLVYDGKFSDPAFYKLDELVGDEFGESFKVVWKHLEEFGSGKPPLYPEGLLQLLAGS
jgi:ADP-ribose pyrophosphatase YjhB (NUDIX family)